MKKDLKDIYKKHLAGTETWSDGRVMPVAGEKVRKNMLRGDTWASLCTQEWQEIQNVWKTRPENIWIWSDLHIGHHNIIKYCDRPFFGVSNMNSSLLDNASNVPDSPDTWLLFLGDIGMWRHDAESIAEFVQLCPGRKALILGNHDFQGEGHPKSFQEWQDTGFDAVASSFVLESILDKEELWMTHYPLHQEFIPPKVLNVHGHTHNRILEGPYLNVCVENQDYAPKRLLDRLESPHVPRGSAGG